MAKIYDEILGSGAPDRERIAVLEFSGYLERYLWPRFDPARSSRAHLLSIILVRLAAGHCAVAPTGRARSSGVSCGPAGADSWPAPLPPAACAQMVNEKFRQNVAAWSFLESTAPGDAESGAGPAFADFFDRVVGLGHGLGSGASEPQSALLSLKERGAFVLFLVHCFQSLEQDAVRPCVLRLVALPLWASLSTPRLRLELEEHPQLKRRWDPAMARAGLESALRAAGVALGAADAIATTKAARAKVSQAQRTVDAVKQWMQEEGAGGGLAVDDVRAKHGEVVAAAQAAAKTAEPEAKKEEKKKHSKASVRCARAGTPTTRPHRA